MIQAIPVKISPTLHFKFKRYFESKNNKIRIFGQCEVTGKNFELIIPTEGFFVYLQGFQTIDQALKNISEEERQFILTGISPEGRKFKHSSQDQINAVDM